MFFKYLRKDKISKEIGKIKKTVNNKLDDGKITLLKGHKILVNEITEIYNKDDYSYNDLLKRRNMLKNFNSNYKNIIISFAFGLFSSIIVSNIAKFINNNIKLSKFLDFIISAISSTVFLLITFALVILIIIYSAKKLSEEDKLHTDEYELKIIEKKLEKLEK